MPAPIPVRPGQVWADKNQWAAGRTVRIVEVRAGRAITEVVTESGAFRRQGLRSTVGRRSRVLFDDRGLRGYRLVSEPDDTTGSAT